MLSHLALLGALAAASVSSVRADTLPYVTEPNLPPLPYNISYTAPNARLSDGYVFIAPHGGSPVGLYIMDSRTQSAVYIAQPERVMNASTGAFDWRPQTLQGRTVMTWWDGYVSGSGYGSGQVHMMDQGFSEVATLGRVNTSDLHESRLTGANNTMLVTHYQERPQDLSSRSPGTASGSILDGCFEEVSVPEGTQLFYWCMLEHGYGIADSYVDPVLLPAPVSSNSSTSNSTATSSSTMVSSNSTALSVASRTSSATARGSSSSSSSSMLRKRHTLNSSASSAAAASATVSPSASGSTSGGTGSTLPYDYAHVNSVVKDSAGNYLLSVRHLCALLYVDGQTKAVLWQLGGKRSTFTGDGTSFCWQHDAQWVGETSWSAQQTLEASNGGKRQLSLFDNASNGFAKNATQSRGMLIELDFAAKSASMRAEYSTPGGCSDLLSDSQGSMQFLNEDSPASSSGNVLVGYGSKPVFAEYDVNGTALQSVWFGHNETQSYRVYKVQTTALTLHPETAPAVAILNGTLFVSWNGATEVTTWRIRQGSNATDVSKRGFETIIPLGNGTQTLFVEALNADGTFLARSENMTPQGGRLGGAIKGVTPAAAVATHSPSATPRAGNTSTQRPSGAAALALPASVASAVGAALLLGVGLALL